jgi:hypothetical protein
MINKILLDTSSYLRLAYTIDPLLKKPFGNKNNELFVLPELDKEFQRNPRLRNKFDWVNEDQFYQNRKEGRLRLRDPQKGAVNRALEVMTRQAEVTGNGSSPIDIKCLAYGHVLKIQVVTDDLDMLSLAAEFQVQMLGSLGLLRIMRDQSFLTLKQINDTVKYWIITDDCPSDLYNQYEKFFHKKLPM